MRYLASEVNSGFGATSQRPLTICAQNVLDAIRCGCAATGQLAIGATALAEAADVSRRSVPAAVALLRERGLIRVVERGRGPGRPTIYEPVQSTGATGATDEGNRCNEPAQPVQLARGDSTRDARVDLATSSSLRSEEESAASLRSAAAPSASADAGELHGQIVQILTSGACPSLDPLWRDPKAGIAVRALLDEGVKPETVIAAAQELASRPYPCGYGLLKLKASEFHNAAQLPSNSNDPASAPGGSSYAQPRSGRRSGSRSVEYVERNGRRLECSGFLAAAIRIQREEADRA